MSERTAALADLERAKLRGDGDYIVRAMRDPITRGLAAKYAGELQLPEAVPVLKSMLRSKDSYARAAAAASLGKLDAHSATAELAHIARQDSVPAVRAWAAGALGEIGGQE